MPARVLTTFKVYISFGLNPEQRDAAFQAINQDRLGRRLLADEAVDASHTAAHHAAARHYGHYVDVELLDDGTLRLRC